LGLSTSRRIGLMGGSFDPVHQAHVALAQVALDHLGLDEVRWIPVGQAWQKARALTAAQHRLAMLQLATQAEPRFVLDPIETTRPGPSYTLDTIRALQEAAPASNQWYLIIGQDQYANLHTWHGFAELLQRVHLAVACRGDQGVQQNPALAGVNHQLTELPLPLLQISSTDIRSRLVRGEDVHSLAPALVSTAVAGYIATHQLYASGHPSLNGHP
jgi:nicotinate-nucleotide adenylyltransferase